MDCWTANVTNPAVATSISATTWPILLLALIMVLGVAGGVGLVLSGAACSSAAASQVVGRAFETSSMWRQLELTPQE
jgi:hypothetical protein